jgi:hypothetical protein
MKLRGLVVLLMLLGIAQAQEVRFGVKLGLDFPQIVGAMARADFGEYGVRVTAGGFFGFYSLEAHGFYQFLTSADGSGGYIGLGAGLLANYSQPRCDAPIPDPPPGPNAPPITPINCANPWWDTMVSGLLGYELALSHHVHAFAELRPLYQLFPPYGYRSLPIIPAFGVGLNWWF